MPNRFIKESCRSSKNLDKLSDFEERLFWRLVTTADDYGRFLACPELVRSACFPYKTVSTDRILTSLQALQTNDLIMLYHVDDRTYGVFVKWEKHQGKPRAKISKYPEMIASASNCMQTLAHVPGGPNTNTRANTDTQTDSEGEKIVKKRGNGLTAFPQEWKLDLEKAEGWRKFGLNPAIEFASFRDHALTTNRRCADWEAAFRNWCRKSIAKKEDSHGVRPMR